MARRLWAAWLALVLALAGMAGCIRPQATGRDERPVPGGTLTLGLTRAPGGIFRPLASEVPDVITGLMYSGLLQTGPHLELVCDLCERFTVGADQRSVTFTLRRDVQWHDGKPFTAADVAFTYRAILAPAYAGARAGQLAALAGVQKLLDERDAVDRQVVAGRLDAARAGARKAEAWKRWLEGPGRQAIQVADAHTVTFGMDQPYAPLLSALLAPISPAHTEQPVGTGPFKLAEFKRGESVRLVRHQAYHLGAPHLDAVVFRVVAPDQAMAAVQNGTVDFVPIGVENLDSRGAGPGRGGGGGGGGDQVRVVEWPSPGYQYLGINHDLPMFADRRVRQALMYGINRGALVERLLKGHGAVANTHLPAGHWAVLNQALNGYPYDPGRAAALLHEAGWSQFSKDGYRMRDGEQLAFTLKVPRGNPFREASAAMIQRDLKVLGVKVRLEPGDLAQVTREVFGARQAEAWLLGWAAGVDPDPGPAFSPGNKWGRASGWAHPRSGELLGRGARTLDAMQRKAIYGEWAQLANDELPYLFLYSGHSLAAVRADRVRGVAPDLRGPYWNIHQWWIRGDRQHGGARE